MHTETHTQTCTHTGNSFALHSSHHKRLSTISHLFTSRGIRSALHRHITFSQRVSSLYRHFKTSIVLLLIYCRRFGPYRRLSTPVRGVSCKHFDCFDCSTFMAKLKVKSAQRKRRRSTATLPCPICETPYSFEALFIDGFMEEVLSSELAQKEPHLRYVAVSVVDGSWVLKLEPVKEVTWLTRERVSRSSSDLTHSRFKLPSPRRSPAVWTHTR